MVSRQPPLVPAFNVPNFALSCSQIFLAGHSYYLIGDIVVTDSDSSSTVTPDPLTVLYPSRDETAVLPEFRLAIIKSNIDSLKRILDTRPALPRLLLNPRGRCDQECHTLLFGLLLVLGRVRDLERLYGVVPSSSLLPVGQSHSDHLILAEDGDEEMTCITITQREEFGNRAALVHESIAAQRSENTTLSSVWSPDPIFYAASRQKATKKHFRIPIRCLSIEKMVGKGSYGFVYESGGLLKKFSTTTSEYVRELLSQCVLTLTSKNTGLSVAEGEKIPSEVKSPTSATSSQVQHHILTLTQLSAITRSNIVEFIQVVGGIQAIDSSKNLRGLEMTAFDQLALICRSLFNGVRSLRDRFMMHLDLSTTNVMWDKSVGNGGGVRVIDYGGTIGDDSFLDIGTIVSRVCTRSTRAPEYGSGESLWQRNESSETLSAYHAIMSHAFSPTLTGTQPYAKEEACSLAVKLEMDAWDREWRARGKNEQREDEQVEIKDQEPIPAEIECIRRVHQASRILPRDRPPLDWLLSNGTDSGDRHALEMGCIGSIARYTHVRHCLSRFVSQWPRGVPLDPIADIDSMWLSKRTIFISILISRLTCTTLEGITCGGLASRLVPPPYTAVRCVSIYDALRDIILLSVLNSDSESVEPVLIRYMSEPSCYPVLVNAILYLALAPSKSLLVEVEHYANHPLHVIIRTIVRDTSLVSIFLSPITAYSLLILETPRACVNDEAALDLRNSMQTPIPKPATSHRILRCLYNLKSEHRCRPMHGSHLKQIAQFSKSYMSRLFRAPIVVDSESDWWRTLLRIEGTVAIPPLLSDETLSAAAVPAISQECTAYVDSVLNLWFT